MSKTFYKIIIVIQFVAIVMLTIGLFVNDPFVSTKQTSDTELVSQSKILQNEEQYRQVYDLPDIKFLRTTFDNYSNDRSSNKYLDAFDKSYYESKFVVFSVNDGLSGGKDIQLIFQDKPDQIFNAWVYELADGNYELRDFKSEEYPAERMHEVVESYKDYIFSNDLAI